MHVDSAHDQSDGCLELVPRAWRIAEQPVRVCYIFLASSTTPSEQPFNSLKLVGIYAFKGVVDCCTTSSRLAQLPSVDSIEMSQKHGDWKEASAPQAQVAQLVAQPTPSLRMR